MSTNMELWIAALRSGEYEQITGTLSCDTNTAGVIGYCCLGVAEVLREEDERPAGGLPHYELADWLGVYINKDELENPDEWDPRIDIPHTITKERLLEVLDVEQTSDNLDALFREVRASQGVRASALNDEYVLNFAQIANLIEAFGIKEDTHE